MKRWTIGLGCALLFSFLALPSKAYQDEKGRASEEEYSAKSGRISETQCVEGKALGFPCSNVNLLSFMSLSDLGASTGIHVNDAWGWTDSETGKRYALVAREDGMSFVDITDPLRPIYVGQMFRTQTALPHVWRDVKTDGNYAFVVADGGSSQGERHGMQVVDLRKLREYAGSPLTLQADALYDKFAVAHNIAINEESHRAYIVGGTGPNVCGPGIHIVDIKDPLQPEFMGCFLDSATGRGGSGYTHDTQCVIYRGPDQSMKGREVCFSSNETAISISDMTDPLSPVAVGKGTYPGASYVHQGWLTEDQRYFVQNDELDERAGFIGTRTMIWDVLELDQPTLLGIFTSPVHSVDHNLYIRDGFAFQANYSSGLRMLDIRVPENPVLSGWFDTTPDNDAVSFDGTWTAYPFPDSDLIVVTSRAEGLFLLRPSDILGTRFESTNARVEGGRVTFDWTMFAEQNVQQYRIERKLPDGTFETSSVVSSLAGPGQFRPYQTALEPGEGVFTFRISALSQDGGQISSDEMTVVSMEGPYLLDDPYPNPVQSVFRSSLSVRETQTVSIVVFDVRGRQVLSLFEGTLHWNSPLQLVADAGSLGSGLYFLRVNGETFSTTREFVVTR